MRHVVPGMRKCWGKNCPNGGATSLFSDDTLVVGKKAYCSVCRGQAENPGKSRSVRPSAAQIDVLERMALAGMRIMPQRGGFWVLSGTYAPVREPGANAEYEAMGLVPSNWSTVTLTIRAMEKHGLLRRVNLHQEAWRDERELTDAGREALMTAVTAGWQGRHR